MGVNGFPIFPTEVGSPGSGDPPCKEQAAAGSGTELLIPCVSQLRAPAQGCPPPGWLAGRHQQVLKPRPPLAPPSLAPETTATLTPAPGDSWQAREGGGSQHEPAAPTGSLLLWHFGAADLEAHLGGRVLVLPVSFTGYPAPRRASFKGFPPDLRALSSPPTPPPSPGLSLCSCSPWPSLRG